MKARKHRKLRLSLERAGGLLRKEGVRSLWFRVLGATAYRRLLLLERPLQEPISDVMVRLPVEIGQLRTVEVAEHVRFRAESGSSMTQSRLDAGQLCFVVRHQGAVVSSCWAATTRVWIDYLSRELRLGPEEVYSYDSFTEPALRGSNLEPARLTEKLRYFRDAGYRRMVCAVSPENRASLRACAKVGYRPYGLIGYVKVGLWKWHFCRMSHAAMAWPHRG